MAAKLVSHGYLTPRSVFRTVIILVSTGRVIADAGSMTSDLAMGGNCVNIQYLGPDHKN